MSEATSFVQSAIGNSKKMMPEYWQKCLLQRSETAGQALGSRYPMTPEEIENTLLHSEWREHDHPSVKKGCWAFKSDIPGFMGMIPITSLPENSILSLEDPKNTGKYEAVYSKVVPEHMIVSQFSIIILGQHDGMWVVYTFHPGEPIMPSTVPSEPNLVKKVTKKEAMKMGFEFVKVG